MTLNGDRYVIFEDMCLYTDVPSRVLHHPKITKENKDQDIHNKKAMEATQCLWAMGRYKMLPTHGIDDVLPLKIKELKKLK